MRKLSCQHPFGSHNLRLFGTSTLSTQITRPDFLIENHLWCKPIKSLKTIENVSWYLKFLYHYEDLKLIVLPEYPLHWYILVRSLDKRIKKQKGRKGEIDSVKTRTQRRNIHQWTLLMVKNVDFRKKCTTTTKWWDFWRTSPWPEKISPLALELLEINCLSTRFWPLFQNGDPF